MKKIEILRFVLLFKNKISNDQKSGARPGVGPHAKDVQYGLKAQYMSKHLCSINEHEIPGTQIKMCEL